MLLRVDVPGGASAGQRDILGLMWPLLTAAANHRLETSNMLVSHPEAPKRRPWETPGPCIYMSLGVALMLLLWETLA